MSYSIPFLRYVAALYSTTSGVMATFFGEVVFDSSRAVDEDDEEDENVEEIE